MAPRVCSSMSRERVRWSLNFERSPVNPRYENESSTKSRLVRSHGGKCEISSHVISLPVVFPFLCTLATTKANRALWICNKGARNPFSRVWFSKRAGGRMCQASVPLSSVKAVGGTAHSCLSLHSHSVVTWDTLPRLRWGFCPKLPQTTCVKNVFFNHFLVPLNKKQFFARFGAANKPFVWFL